jgi:hypothetical protein
MKCYEYIREASYNLAVAREMAFFLCPPIIEEKINEIISEIRSILSYLTYEDYNPNKHIQNIEFCKKYAYNKVKEYTEYTRMKSTIEDHYSNIVFFTRLYGELEKASVNLKLFEFTFCKQQNG